MCVILSVYVFTTVAGLTNRKGNHRAAITAKNFPAGPTITKPVDIINNHDIKMLDGSRFRHTIHPLG